MFLEGKVIEVYTSSDDINSNKIGFKVMVDNEIINILEEQNEDNIKIYKDDDVLIHKQVIDGKEYLDIYLAS